MSSKIESVQTITEPYQIEKWNLPIIEINELESISQNPNYLVVDVRDQERYDGIFEPIDLIAGHIPGAINIPLTENLDQRGLFLKPNELKNKYEAIIGDIKNENIIVHCGSGVTACHTLLALDYAEMGMPKLYVGSWSDRIIENIPNQFVSIQHYGLFQANQEITEGPEVEKWANGFEKYSFQENDGVTTVTVDLDTTEDFVSYMNEKYPKALDKLKEICGKS